MVEKEKNYKRKISGIFRNRHLMMMDAVFVVLSYLFSTMLINNIYDSLDIVWSNALAVVLTMCIYLGAMYLFGMYRIMWVYSGTRDYLRLAELCLGASAVTFVMNLIFFPSFYYKLSIVATGLISMLFVAMRMFVRALNNIYMAHHTARKDRKRLMIVGAGTSAVILLRDIASNVNLNYEVVCFVDDDRNKTNASLGGIKVLGTRWDIPSLAEKYDIDEILLAMPSADRQEIKRVIEICNETDCRVRMLPSIDQMIDDGEMFSKIRNVQIEDLLARDPVKLDNSGIRSYIEGKVILVTGGGGSIGSELCRQIMNFDPKQLVILDIYENCVYDLQMELNKKYPENKPEIVIASVRDMNRLEQVFSHYRPYIVFHAAAHKHVPLMEDSPGEAVKNNVFGTLNVTRCASKYGVKRFVMISTDKAVNPTNVMGATKRICEMIVQCAQKNSETKFVCVRFGNVLGSNGSVIPLFKKQIEEGGPVTVTDKRITRFFMTIPEASQLVLQAAAYAKGGEIFVLDMGEPVRIYDLAKNLIRLSGYKPGVDIKIEEVGLRPGEKLYEELLMDEEGLTSTAHNKIFIGKPLDVSPEYIERMLDKLKKAAEEDDNEQIKDTVAEVVPTYVRNTGIYKRARL